MRLKCVNKVDCAAQMIYGTLDKYMDIYLKNVKCTAPDFDIVQNGFPASYKG